jgi:hypothetical protein
MKELFGVVPRFLEIRKKAARTFICPKVCTQRRSGYLFRCIWKTGSMPEVGGDGLHGVLDENYGCG